MLPDQKFNNLFAVFGGNEMQWYRSIGIDYHAVITLNFKTVLLKHPVLLFMETRYINFAKIRKPSKVEKR
jgi:hypothetical protein